MLDLLVDLFPVHADIPWCFNAQPDLATAYPKNREFDVVGNNECFAHAS